MSRSEANAVGGDGGPYRRALDEARGRLGRLASAVFFYPTIGSTNDAAASFVEKALSGNTNTATPAGEAGDYRETSAAERTVAPSLPDLDGIVVIADEQTAGRGRRGHTWFSPRGSGLYVSVVLMPSRAASDPRRAAGLVPLAAGVALVEAIETAAGLSADLKWPNDLYVGRRKIAGILAEAVSGGSSSQPVVLGYGINVGASSYPPALADRATSLETELGRAVDRDRLFIETLAALARRYDDLRAGRFDDILDAWRRHAPSAYGVGVRWTGASGDQTGVTAGIDDEGALLVRCGGRTERIVAGEVFWEM